ncbi:MAG TPA: oxidative damage protection protein [Gammaproteobacteria bacterium]|nr:oxidative damage protection protein [Gammaproteobacteria bacterium]MEC8009485.1 oxidative damage protection protein [Pseudomonadota bacterium]HBF08629.1 oxidative damage protection protein [Gammaproteobacteria bacterium]HCK91819.1 oxidative damage protection protein [Gammaproteobacteria bacterium]|tara:strand:+ start:550 stop:825 length:276 start_codon:yes stop_codon:yes gene_type:complete
MRTVFCRKYQDELPGLDRAPFPGPAGHDIYENVSAKAWDEWLAHQKRLINEKHLELFDPNTRTYLQEQMILFFKNDDFDKASGYTAEKPES